MHIVFYISSHGLGHYVRSAALAYYLKTHEIYGFPRDDIDTFSMGGHAVRAGHITLIANSTGLLEIMQRDPLLAGMRLMHRPFDITIIEKNPLVVDARATLNGCTDFISRADRLIVEEKKFLRHQGADLVFSDIGFVPVAAAGALNLPVYLLGNFTWEEILYDYHTKGYGAYKSDLLFLLDCYNMADTFFRLPLYMKLRINVAIRDVGFITRGAPTGGKRVRARLGLKPAQRLIFDTLDTQAMGGFSFPSRCWPRDTRLIVWQRDGKQARKTAAPNDQVLYVTERDMDFVEILAASDVVVGKPGYNLMAQAVLYNKRLVVFERRDFVESKALISGASRFVPCRVMPLDALCADCLVKEVNEVQNVRMGKRLKPDMYGEIAVYRHLFQDGAHG